MEFDRFGKGRREALGMEYISSNTWNGLELKLAWSKKNTSYFENNFPIFLLPGKFEYISFEGVWCFTLNTVLSNEHLLQYFP